MIYRTKISFDLTVILISFIVMLSALCLYFFTKYIMFLFYFIIGVLVLLYFSYILKSTYITINNDSITSTILKNITRIKWEDVKSFEKRRKKVIKIFSYTVYEVKSDKSSVFFSPHLKDLQEAIDFISKKGEEYNFSLVMKDKK